MTRGSKSARRVSRNAWLIFLVAGLVCGGVFWRWAETTVYAATFVVNTSADSDDGLCSSAASGCTLREAINAANASAGDDTINFNIPGPGVKTIQLNSNLPVINGLLTINGYSQPGASPNTLTHGNNAVLLIELSGDYTESNCCPETGLHLAGPGNFVRGLVINRFKGNAISIPSNENSIQGNYIGTDPSGTQALGNNIGVSSNGKNVLVGGMSPGDRNVISGNRQDGIQVNGDEAPVSTQMRNNYIGTARDGETPLGNFRGIFLFEASHTDSRNNIIAFNHREGIIVSENSTDNTILANSIHSNGGLGIDLRGGTEDSLDVTANDTGDADTGANNLQNFPVITSVDVQAVSTLVFFSVDSTPNTSLTVQLFTNDSCDPSGHGEGQELGATFGVSSGPTGMATFQLGFGPNAPYFTMTATSSTGTSEFSPCVAAVDKTFTVNTNADTNDGVCNTTHCTLREAINAANATTDLDTIVFNIPGAGVHTIAPASPLPDVNQPVIIDGYTQPGSSPNTLVDGENAVLLIELSGANGSGNGLELEAGSCVVRGLIINRFSSGRAILVNMDDGGNVIAGNFIGTNSSGASALGNEVGIYVFHSQANRIGGLSPADRNVISGNFFGVDLAGTSARGNVVQGNFIGTNAAGTAALANTEEGVRFTDSAYNTVGGAVGARNVISGNAGDGVRALAADSNNHVQGNLIGTDVSGEKPLGNAGAGVRFDSVSPNEIGGDRSEFGNVIAFNGGDGVLIQSGGTFISRNSIHSNGGLGINLKGGTENSFGVTANDAGDGDIGPNLLQNFPVLTSASTSGAVTTVGGTLNSTPNTTFRIQYYSSPSCDASGQGEGHKPISERFISSGPGVSALFFSTTLPNTQFSGPFITATATDPEGNTSEFSPCVEAPPTSTVQFGTPGMSVQEDCTEVIFTVSRVGVTSGFGAEPATVEYATQSGSASDRSDFTTARGTLRFEVGETAKTIRVLITEDSFVEGTETATIVLSNPTGAGIGGTAAATLEIIDDPSEPAGNTIDIAEEFVCHHYHDFLNRTPDVDGITFWTNEIEMCGSDVGCREFKRVNVSAAFFLSVEFQQTGFFILRTQRAAFGHKSDAASTRLTYTHFIADAREVGEGVVVGQIGWEQQLESNRQAYVEMVVASTELVVKYPLTLSAEQYVDALFATAVVTPTSTERQEAISAYGGGGILGRVAALRKVADSDSLRAAELNPSFVLMQYFGYLRRNPTDAPDVDDSGYQFWLAKLNQFGGDFQAAQMVKAFILSGEYRSRFGQP